MVDINRKTHEKNDIEIIVYNWGIFWLDEKHIQEGLNQRKFARNYNKIAFKSWKA